MPARVLYHCPCSTDFGSTFGPQVPSSSSHELAALYFCEECDSIRCDLCTTRDLSAFYCPHCQFDVPLASVKQDKAKCPRNCFACPVCTSTLLIAPSDVGDAGQDGTHHDPRSAEASVGEPPYSLACPTCRWDSRESGLIFDKPTGMMLQMQRRDEMAADAIEFQNLRTHLDTYLRVADVPTAALAARSSRLLRDVPSLANDPNFAPNRWGAKRKGRLNASKDEQMPAYQAAMTWDAGRDKQRTKGLYTDLHAGKALGHLGRKEQDRIDAIESLTTDENLSALAQRWETPHDQSLYPARAGPSRIALRAKQTKRCPACRHIIIRPDTKPASHKFKIRLLALNHLPDVQIRLPSGSSLTEMDSRRSRASVLSTAARRRAAPVDVEALIAGRSYLFEAAFQNPLDEAITVSLHIGRLPDTSEADAGRGEDAEAQVRKHQFFPPFRVTPTASSFPVSAFNAVWELEEEDDELLDEDDADLFPDADKDRGGRRKQGRGILRKRGHQTVIGLELKLGSETSGDVEFPMQITYTHRLDASEASKNSKDGQRSFSFWTFVRLGHVTGQSEIRAGGIRRMPTSLASAFAAPSPVRASASSPVDPDASPRLAPPPASPVPQTPEQRREALDKKRSIMGLGESASQRREP